MKWYSRIGICIGAFIFSLASSSFIVKNVVEKSIQPYVESHIVTIIKDQEERLGIQHFGIPRIAYKQKISLSNGPLESKEGIGFGIYKAKADEIHLSLRYLVTPDTSLVNTIATEIFGILFPRVNVKEVLDHELGHFYIDKFNESLGKGDWSNRNRGKKIISEGICEYFRIVLNNGGKHDFADYGGLPIVKPILDRYGKRGIDYLITNPPNVEMEDILGYQNKVLEALSEYHNQS